MRLSIKQIVAFSHRPGGTLLDSFAYSLRPRRLWEDVFQLLLPSYCLICGRRLYQGVVCHYCTPKPEFLNLASRCFRCFTPSAELNSAGLCQLCLLHPLPFTRLRYLWPYDTAAKQLIRIMKYRPSRKLCYYAGQLLADNLPLLFPEHASTPTWDIIIPIPSSRPSLIARGFNQCLLAAGVLKQLPELKQIPLAAAALRHCGYRSPQASLSGDSRLKNVSKAFCATPALVAGKSVLLLDDVVTTGATTAAAAKALLAAGAATIDLLALARSETWQEFRYKLSSFPV